MKRRQFLATLAATGGAAALAACAPKVQPTAAPAEKPAEKPAQPSAPTAAPAAKAPVTIQLHLRAGGEQSEVPIYVTRPAEFMEENPNIKVELAPIPGGEYQTKIQTMAAAKTIGDVMWTSDVWTDHTRYVKTGIIAVVDDWLAANNHPKTEWLPACVATLTHDGKMYGLPKCSHPADAYIWINDDAFAAAGLKVPEQFGNALADLPEWAAKLSKGTKADRQAYGYGANKSSIMPIYSAMRQYGGIELNPEGTKSMADSEEWFAYMSFMDTVYEENYTPRAEAIPSGGIEALFAAGKLAMIHAQRSTNRRVKIAMKDANEPFKWKTIQYPRGPKANGWLACVDTHSATTFSKHPEEAHKLAYAMADPRFSFLVARDIGYIGGRVDDAETIKDLIPNDQFLSLQAACGPQELKINQPANARGKEVETLLMNEMDKFLLGQDQLTKDTMKQLKGKIDEVLAKAF